MSESAKEAAGASNHSCCQKWQTLASQTLHRAADLFLPFIIVASAVRRSASIIIKIWTGSGEKTERNLQRWHRIAAATAAIRRRGAQETI